MIISVCRHAPCRLPLARARSDSLTSVRGGARDLLAPLRLAPPPEHRPFSFGLRGRRPRVRDLWACRGSTQHAARGPSPCAASTAGDRALDTHAQSCASHPNGSWPTPHPQAHACSLKSAGRWSPLDPMNAHGADHPAPTPRREHDSVDADEGRQEVCGRGQPLRAALCLANHGRVVACSQVPALSSGPERVLIASAPATGEARAVRVRV